MRTALLIIFAIFQTAAAEPSLATAKKIVFLGDSITYAGDYVAFFEAWLGLKHPSGDRVVLNLGLPSETVSGLSEEGHAGGKFPRPDLYERLERVLAATQPDLVVACYGMNCGIYQTFSEKRFAAYREGIEKLKKTVEGRGAGLILITPWAFDDLTGKNAAPDYDHAVLGRYSEWLLSKKTDGWEVIDLHGPMVAAREKRRGKDPGFTFQQDGIHPGREGHWLAARALIEFADPDESVPEGLEDYETLNPNLAKLFPLFKTRTGILRDAWLTETKHLRPGISAGLPIPEAEEKAAGITLDIEAALPH